MIVLCARGLSYKYREDQAWDTISISQKCVIANYLCPDVGLLYANSYYSDQVNSMSITQSYVRNKDHLNLRVILIQVQMPTSESQDVNARSCNIFNLPEKFQTGEKTRKYACFMAVFGKPIKAMPCYTKYEIRENGT